MCGFKKHLGINRPGQARGSARRGPAPARAPREVLKSEPARAPRGAGGGAGGRSEHRAPASVVSRRTIPRCGAGIGPGAERVAGRGCPPLAAVPPIATAPLRGGGHVRACGKMILTWVAGAPCAVPSIGTATAHSRRGRGRHVSARSCMPCWHRRSETDPTPSPPLPRRFGAARNVVASAVRRGSHTGQARCAGACAHARGPGRHVGAGR